MATALDSVVVCQEALSRSYFDRLLVEIISWPLWANMASFPIVGI